MMSSPIRQMNQRRLPPLPGVQQGKSGRGGRPTTEEMIITGKPVSVSHLRILHLLFNFKNIFFKYHYDKILHQSSYC